MRLGWMASLCAIPFWIMLLFSSSVPVLLLANFVLLGLSLIWIAPAMADVHELTGPYLRGLGVGVFLCLVHVAAYGVGSPLIGKLNDLLGAWEAGGVREFILLTAHRYDPHQEALATVITATARVRVVDIFAVDVADLLDGQTEPMHGDEVDTSLLLHIAPELVDMSAAQDYMVSRTMLRRFWRGRLPLPPGSPGSLGHARMASAEKGRRIYERILDRVSDRVLAAPARAG